ncbi:hypothetical protein B0H14DRAFT_3151968 [Mycena olivaceomarginata]|nr:hypothetical protein B0H14DRAFT_3151968 [Mycena olivaceomarginata]
MVVGVKDNVAALIAATQNDGGATQRQINAARAGAGGARRERRCVGPAQEVDVGIIGRRAAGAGGRSSTKTRAPSGVVGFAPAKRSVECVAPWREALRGGDAPGGTGKQKAPAKQDGQSAVETGAVGVIGDALWEHTVYRRCRRMRCEGILDASESAESTLHGILGIEMRMEP